MTEEMKYYTGNCITDLHTDTSISSNEEKCKQYINSDGLKFCMSSVCPEKDCIYALVNKLHQKIDGLEQENKRLNERLYCYAYEKDCHLQCKQKDCAIKNYYKYKSALEEIRELAKTITDEFEEMDFEQQKHYCDEISNNIVSKINEVLNDK